MKTRQRSNGRRQRMTVSSSVVHDQEDSGKNGKTSFNSTKEGSGKGNVGEQETRSQKFASKSSCDAPDQTINEPKSASDISLPATGVSTRSSSRPAKRRKISTDTYSTTGTQDAKDGPQTASTSVTTGQKNGRKRIRKKRVKRQWDAWGIKDKNAFFDALNDFGKDFDKIQSHLATKHKRRGDPANLIKNKDQVRHFYYRTLNKISKFIPQDKQPTGESDPHQRTVHELVGLTCYGELRKKLCGGLDGKQGKKLNELIANGTTTIRYNGRTVRLKAPSCRTLKENELSNQPPPLPQKLVLEFLPIDNVAWAVVQRLSQNPRLKTTVCPKKSLGSVINFLMSKWPVKSAKTGEALELCILIPDNYVINTVPELSPVEGATSDDTVSVNQARASDVHTVGESTTNTFTSTSTSDAEHEVAKINEESSATLGKDGSPNTPSCSKSIDMKGSPYRSVCTGVKNLRVDSLPDNKLWTPNNCGNLTIGEIYCKLKRPLKLMFEYTWSKEKDSIDGYCANSLKKLVRIAKTEFHNVRRANQAAKAARLAPPPCAPVTSSKPQAAKYIDLSKATRIAPKHQFILPSIVPSAVSGHANFVVPNSVASNRKRVRKNREYAVHAPAAAAQRKLLPRPGTAAPPGAVAVSFIPHPGQTASSPTLASKSGSRTSRSAASAPAVSSTVSSPTTPSTDMSSSASSPVMPLTPVASPVPFNESSAPSPIALSEPVTTVLETGVRQRVTLEEEPLATDTEPQAVKPNPDSPSVSVGSPTFGNHFDSPLQDLTDGNVTSELNTVIGLASDPIVNINEDSGSDLLASIMGLSKTATTSLLAATSTTNNACISPKMAPSVHVEEIHSTISGDLQAPYAGLSELLGTSSNGIQGAPVTGPGFLGMSDVNGTAMSVVTSDKLLSCPATTAASPVISPSLSPITQAVEHTWLNGGDTSDSFSSLLDKITVSPEKGERRIVQPETPVAAMDMVCQDYLHTPRHPTIASEMDKALQSMMDENSVDYVRKFQDLVKGFSDHQRAGDGSSSDSSSSGGLFSFKNILGKGSGTDDQL